MSNISLALPVNEPFSNLRESDQEWEKFSAAVKNIPKNFDVPMIINGKKVYSSTKIENKNPSTGEVIGTLSQADSSHAEQAVAAALAAKEAWAALSPETRLQKFRDLELVIAKWKYEMLAIASYECGFNAYETIVEWAELMDFIRFNMYYYKELLKEELGDGWGETNTRTLRPLKGFTCAVTPFNFPQAIGYNLPLVMALTGNTVVWKPSDDAVISAYILMLALDEAGFPPGVINMITGDGKQCLPTVLKHPELTALNFTGSFATARSLGNYLYNTEFQRLNFPRFVAETGGKDFLVADADIDVVDTARCIAQGAFGRSGQKCSANSALYVDEKIWPALSAALVKETEAIVQAVATERNCDIGPVINERQFDKIAGYIERAKADSNCKILVGGKHDKTRGFYVTPTVVEVNQDFHYMLAEEIFGPVISVRTYKKFEDVIPMLNQHQYRLTGSVISKNESFLERTVPILSQYAGNFYINRKTTGAIVNMQPFGGDAASGTNSKAGAKWYLLNFVSQGTVTRRHARTTTPAGFDKLVKF